MKTQAENYHEKHEAFLTKAFDLKPSEVNLVDTMALSVMYETAKNNPALVGDLYRALKTYEAKIKNKYAGQHVQVIYLEDGDLVLDFNESKFFIEGAEEEIKNQIHWKLMNADWDQNFKYEEDKEEAVLEAAVEELARFDLIDYATDNLDRWEFDND